MPILFILPIASFVMSPADPELFWTRPYHRCHFLVECIFIGSNPA